MRVKYVSIDSCYQCKYRGAVDNDCGHPCIEEKRKEVLNTRPLEKYEYKGHDHIPEWCPLPDTVATTIIEEK